jgi:endonuclease YncB( thermonuclease family)
LQDTLYRFPGKVIRVVDGDTFVVEFALFPTEHYQYPKFLVQHKVRLLGVDTDELKSKDALEKAHAYEAKDFTTQQLLNQDIIVQATGEDAFGRLLAKVYLNEVEFNSVLLEKGLAKIYKR